MMEIKDYKNLALQLRLYAKRHDVPPYGRAIEGEEDLERDAADAIEELLELAQKQAEMIRVETPLGALIARPSGFGPENPGIFIDIRQRDADQDLLLALIECTSDEADFPDEERHIITRVYGDALNDEFTERIVHHGVEEYFMTE